MSAIVVKFGGQTLPNVVSVQPGSTLSADAIVDRASMRGLRTRRIVVQGFVRRPDRLDMLGLQKDTEDAFTAKGPGTLEFPGITPYAARLVGWDWESWAGNPIVKYTATFEAEVENPFSKDVTIAEPGGETSITLRPRPAVSDSFKSPDPVDERPSASREKAIALSGVLAGALAEVETQECALRSLLTKTDLYSVTIPSGVYTCRVASFSFSTPAGNDREATKTYEIEMATPPDFTMEGRALQGGPATVAGITFDVASSWNRSVSRDAAGVVTSELLSVSGKKFFASMADANTFRDQVDALVVGRSTYSSPTGKVLVVKSSTWNEPRRDGHDTSGNRRYSLSFSLSLEVDRSGAAQPSTAGIVLGVTFASLESVSFSASLAEDGSVSSRSKNASGKVASDPAVRPGDQVLEDGTNYVVTSLSLGSFDDSGRRQVSVAGQTLDSSKAAERLFALVFAGFALDHVQSSSRSVSYQRDECTGKYKATQVSASVSGFRIGSDGAVLDLVRTIDRLGGDFIVTSVSTGAPERKVVGGGEQIRFPVSISGQINLDPKLGSCNEPPDIKTETTRQVEDATAKYTQVPIPGKGIVYKKIGVNPGTETVTVRNVARTEGIYRTMGFPADPTPTIRGAQSIGRSTGDQGLTKSVTVRFQAYTEVTNA